MVPFNTKDNYQFKWYLNSLFDKPNMHRAATCRLVLYTYQMHIDSKEEKEGSEGFEMAGYFGENC